MDNSMGIINEDPKKVMDEFKPKVQETQVARRDIELDDHGLPVPTTLDELFRVARMYVNSGLVPKHFDTPEKFIVARQFATELGFRNNVLAALRQIYVVNGSPAIWGELPLALCRRSGVLKNIREYWTTKTGEPCGPTQAYRAVCEVERSDSEEIVVREFSVDDAEKANLTKKDLYRLYLPRMLQMRARSWALKDCCPEIFMGVAIAEYDYHTNPEVDGYEPRQRNAEIVAKTVEAAIAEREAESEIRGEDDGQSV